jgi:hypothetical protein
MIQPLAPMNAPSPGARTRRPAPGVSGCCCDALAVKTSRGLSRAPRSSRTTGPSEGKAGCVPIRRGRRKRGDSMPGRASSKGRDWRRCRGSCWGRRRNCSLERLSSRRLPQQRNAAPVRPRYAEVEERPVVGRRRPERLHLEHKRKTDPDQATRLGPDVGNPLRAGVANVERTHVRVLPEQVMTRSPRSRPGATTHRCRHCCWCAC